MGGDLEDLRWEAIHVQAYLTCFEVEGQYEWCRERLQQSTIEISRR